MEYYRDSNDKTIIKVLRYSETTKQEILNELNSQGIGHSAQLKVNNKSIISVITPKEQYLIGYGDCIFSKNDGQYQPISSSRLNKDFEPIEDLTTIEFQIDEMLDLIQLIRSNKSAKKAITKYINIRLGYKTKNPLDILKEDLEKLYLTERNLLVNKIRGPE